MFVRVFAPGKSPRPHRDAREVVFCFVLLFSRLAPRGMRAALPKGPVGRNVSPIGNHTSREREGEKKSAAITMWRFDSSSVRIYFIFPCRRLRCRSRGAFFSFSYFKNWVFKAPCSKLRSMPAISNGPRMNTSRCNWRFKTEAYATNGVDCFLLVRIGLNLRLDYILFIPPALLTR